MGIRAKFIVTLVLAVVAPVVLALFSLRYIGEHYYLNQRGNQFAVMAHELSNGVQQTMELRVNQLYHMVHREAFVSSLGSSDFSASRLLKEIQTANPLFVDLLVTDGRGVVVACCDRPAEREQSEEAWWQRAFGLSAGQVLVSSIAYNESRGLYVYEISLPIHSPDESEPVGMVQGLLDATPLFEGMLHAVKKTSLVREVILGNGQVFIHIDQEGRAAVDQHFPVQAFDEDASRDGFVQLETESDGLILAGFSSVALEGSLNGRIVSYGALPHILVHDRVRDLLRPVNQEMNRVLTFGIAATILVFLLGWYIADRRILYPLTELERAATTLSLVAFDSKPKEVDVYKARSMLERVKKINTRDEFQSLILAFSRMAERALFYRGHMQQEVMEKTSELQKDLETARHFQEALLPDRMPRITSLPGCIPYELSFAYRYQPCVSLGGDFLDVVILSDHEVAVFIADVMGHGATSALVTSMLRTLLHSESLLRYPAAQMNHLHVGFREVLDRMSDPFFITCSLLVFNAQKGEIAYCSAGHPAPLLLDAEGVRPLYSLENNQPAVGLIPEMTYTSETIKLFSPARIVLYTDGMVEALNEAQVEYAQEGLCEALLEGGQLPLEDMSEHLMQHWRSFLGGADQADDVCFVAVDVQGPV